MKKKLFLLLLLPMLATSCKKDDSKNVVPIGPSKNSTNAKVTQHLHERISKVL